jgi:CHASE2 domain-containing sensor protein
MREPKTLNPLRWWAFTIFILAIGLSSFSRLLFGGQVWQPVLLSIAAVVHGSYWLAILFNWRGAQEHYLQNEEQWAREADVPVAPVEWRRRGVRRLGFFGLVLSVLVLISAVIFVLFS